MNHGIKTFHSYLWLLHAYNLPPFKVFHDFEGFFFFLCVYERERERRERKRDRDKQLEYKWIYVIRRNF